jgi:tRNA-splicing ligase RtcB
MQEITTNNVPIRAWIDGVPVEKGAMTQLTNAASLPIMHDPIAVMPDVHFGRGATIGTVLPTRSALIPSAVGVDIGCGMCAVRTSLTANDLPESLKDLRHSIERAIPVGRHDHRDGTDFAREAWDELKPGYERIRSKYPKVVRHAKPVNQIGTLGSGNHFIEVCLDTENRVWVMLHSGSRGIGNAIGQQFIELAMKQARERGTELPDQELAWLDEGTELFDDYWHGLQWAQEYASLNRRGMLEAVLRQLRFGVGEFTLDAKVINCHHNYAAREFHNGVSMYVTRKGAVRAGQDEMGIIPGSMGARSFIVRGRGNPLSYCSCSHGAGRAMSRGDARRSFSVAQHVLATEGVECRKDEHVIDETPMAYKDIDAVMAAQADLVEIVHTLKQVLCVKG